MTTAPCYSATKHGVVGFSRSMTDCAQTDSVRVNCVCPEFVNTQMVTAGLMQAADQETKARVMETGLLE